MLDRPPNRGKSPTERSREQRSSADRNRARQQARWKRPDRSLVLRHIAAPEIEMPELAPMLEAPTDVSVLDAAAPAEGHRDAATTRATDSNRAIWLSV